MTPIREPHTDNEPPVCPLLVSWFKPEPGIGVLKAKRFPGQVGIDVACEIDEPVANLQDCTRLIVDLRGNPGGGAGGLRLMSYFTPGKLPVGYSLSKARFAKGFKTHQDIVALRGTARRTSHARDQLQLQRILDGFEYLDTMGAGSWVVRIPRERI